MIDISEILSEYGSYFEAGGQNMNDLITYFKEALETEQLFPLGIATVGANMSTKVKKASIETSRILQPFQKAWTPIGGITMTPRGIDLFRFKIDVTESPDDLKNSWASFLTSNNLDRATWPFVKWLVYEYLTKQHKQDREMNEIFVGEFVAPTPGTAGAAGTGMDGVRKIIRDNYATGDTGLLALGAPPTDPKDFCTYIENFVKGLPELVKNQGGDIAMNRTLRNRFREGKRLKYNANYAQATDLDCVMDWEQFCIKGVASHTGSNLIWYAPNFNKNRFLVASENEGIFKIESQKRMVDMYTDYYIGLGFWVPQYLFHNDQDLV